jgi:hypothetical protein
MLSGVYREIAAAIREVDHDHILFIEPTQGGYASDVLDIAKSDRRIAYSFHSYWHEPDDRIILSQLDIARANGVPILLGESGENTDDWIARFRAALDLHEVGWAFWTYKRMDTSRSLRTFDKPPFWDELVAFQQAPFDLFAEPSGVLPPREHVVAALEGLLHNSRFEHTHVNAGYAAALGLKP